MNFADATSLIAAVSGLAATVFAALTWLNQRRQIRAEDDTRFSLSVLALGRHYLGLEVAYLPAHEHDALLAEVVLLRPRSAWIEEPDRQDLQGYPVTTERPTTAKRKISGPLWRGVSFRGGMSVPEDRRRRFRIGSEDPVEFARVRVTVREKASGKRLARIERNISPPGH